ncbi:unnamed protein product [Ceutorhynchus assimilis]|uniref:Serine/threonine-protein phosphatase n=1 Tax=Ceutorhynchus assimilis TaxID=467358 RepID=A0A9N9MDU4_9CUCU|nr:unnamed protein product [Ceutorhynchus assimilis]
MPQNTLNVDSVIKKLTGPEVHNGKKTKMINLPESDIKALCQKAIQIFHSQPMLLELEAPIKVAGDIHGQFGDLLKLFQFGGFPPDANYLFLGDYVDRGKQSLETMCLLLAYKIKYPENFFLLRGNHESAQVCKIYGFFDECKRRYSTKLFKIFTDVFNVLPVAAIIDDKIFCCHGGLSPDLLHIGQIRSIQRPCDVPIEGLLCDLLWSDPSPDMGWTENDRGVSFAFGPDVVNKFLQKHDFDLICRGHQVVEDGYEFFAQRKLITIFSAPNYCGTFDNAGALMSINEDLLCSFQFLSDSGMISKKTVVVPNEAKKEHLLMVHKKKYLKSLQCSFKVARIAEVAPLILVPNCFIQKAYLRPMRFQTGGSVLAGKLALDRGWSINIGGGFHHCSASKGGGFCVYADISLLIHFLFYHFPKQVQKVMIVDLDAHQGNGYETDFKDNDSVYIMDVYNKWIYPKDASAKEAIRKNVPIDFYTDDENYLSIVKKYRNFIDALKEFSPDLLVYNAGTDVLVGDRLGGLSLTEQGIIVRDEFVFQQAISRKIPIVMLTSGGYQKKTARIIANSILNLYELGLIHNSQEYYF